MIFIERRKSDAGAVVGLICAQARYPGRGAGDGAPEWLHLADIAACPPRLD
jgi:hypothetical protein